MSKRHLWNFKLSPVYAYQNFSIKFDFFNILFDYKVIIFDFLIKNISDFLIKNVSKLFEKDQKLVKIDKNLTSSFNRNLIFVVRFELDQNRRSNLDGLESKLLTIQLVSTNCLTLYQIMCQIMQKERQLHR